MPDTPRVSKSYEDYVNAVIALHSDTPPDGMPSSEGISSAPSGTPIQTSQVYKKGEKAEPLDYIQREYNSEDGEKITLYSTTGKRKSPKDFDEAIQKYALTGEAPPGFTALSPGIMNTLRSGFEAVNQPLQKGLPQVGAAIGGLAATSPLAILFQKMGVLPEGTSESLTGKGVSAGSSVGESIASSVDTPGKAGAAAGQVGAALATGGTSLLPTIGGAALGGGLGYLAGSSMTGEGIDPGPIATAAITAGFAEGGVGVLKNLLGLGLSQLANKQISTDIMNLLKSRYGSAAGQNPAILEGMMSNADDLAKLTRIGMKGIMSDFDAVASGLKDDIMRTMPRSLSKGGQNTLRSELRSIIEASKDMLDNPGMANQAAVDAVNKAKLAIRNVISNDFSNMSPGVVSSALQKADSVIVDYAASIDKFKPGSMLLKALKDSGARDGFQPQAFQEEIAKYLGSDSLMESAGSIARRGASYGAKDTPVSAKVPVGKMLGLPSFMDKYVNIGPSNIGTKYAGTIRGASPSATAAVAASGNDAIRSFMGERNK
jgi:hypothetical protein